jgi:hypothetical protein
LVVHDNALVECIVLANLDFLRGENPISLIEQQQRLCIVSLLEVLLLENLFCSAGVVFVGVLSVVVGASV